MALYIHQENQDVLMNVLQKTPIFNAQSFTIADQERIDTWFRSVVQQFYDVNRYKTLSPIELQQLNRDTIQYMLHDLSNGRLAPVKQPEIAQKQPELGYAYGSTPFSSAFEPVAAVAATVDPFHPTTQDGYFDGPTKTVTRGFISEQKQKEMSNRFNERQREYTTMLKGKPQPEIDFRNPIEDEPIHNMEELLKRHRREYEQFGMGANINTSGMGMGANINTSGMGMGANTSTMGSNYIKPIRTVIPTKPTDLNPRSTLHSLLRPDDDGNVSLEVFELDENQPRGVLRHGVEPHPKKAVHWSEHVADSRPNHGYSSSPPPTPYFDVSDTDSELAFVDNVKPVDRTLRTESMDPFTQGILAEMVTAIRRLTDEMVELKKVFQSTAAPTTEPTPINTLSQEVGVVFLDPDQDQEPILDISAIPYM